MKMRPLLTPDEEKECFRRVKQGDGEARVMAIESNLSLVISRVKVYMGRGIDFDDLYSMGCLGLVRAVDKFEPSRGLCFSTYAVWWIDSHMKRQVVEDTHAVHVPYRKAKKKSTLAAIKIATAAVKPLYLANGTPRPIAAKESEVIEVEPERLAVAIGRLSERERFVIARRFSECPVRLIEIGREIGLTRERVRQIESEALVKLRERLEA